MIDGQRIIDFHGHQGRWDWLMQDDDPERMLASMDAVGIDQACLFNIFHTDVRVGHAALAKFIQRYPDRFIGFAYATPRCVGDMVDETRRALDDLGFAAIKIYPPYGNILLTDRQWEPLFELANRRGMAVISHAGIEPSCEPKYFDEIAPRYPNAKLVIGHGGNVEPQRSQAIAAAARWPNVYIETCSTYRQPNVIEQYVAGAGAEKILYGSDMPLMDPRCQIGKIITADLSDEQKKLILGGNAMRLLTLTL
jgi:predicted TIM-barrel fold metal-dependent hydrolase